MRIGLGYDIHRFKKSKKGFFLLSGVRIPSGFRMDAHSDGDIMLHAVSDAILSALGLPDIGVYFPPGKPQTRNINSALILKYALHNAKKRKLKVSGASIVVVLEKPKMAPYRAEIQYALAKLLGTTMDKVGITFKTFENLKPFANCAISCMATALLTEGKRK
ncbi:2-C-methyl-D-erythritol 2,4-cyclodiphosphate synthase [Elusimicrobiota bacterium]